MGHWTPTGRWWWWISLYENIHAQCFLEILECVLQAQYKCSAGRIHQCLLLVDNRRQWIDSGRCYMYVDDIMSLSLPLLRMNQYIVHENWSLIGLSYNRPSITILSYGLSVSLSVCLYVCKYARMYAYACMHDNARIHLYVWMCVCLYVCMLECLHAYIHMYAWMHAHALSSYACMYVCMYVWHISFIHSFIHSLQTFI